MNPLTHILPPELLRGISHLHCTVPKGFSLKYLEEYVLLGLKLRSATCREYALSPYYLSTCSTFLKMSLQ